MLELTFAIFSPPPPCTLLPQHPFQTILLNLGRIDIPKIPVQHSGNSSGARQTLFEILASALTLSAALNKSFHVSAYQIPSCVKGRH